MDTLLVNCKNCVFCSAVIEDAPFIGYTFAFQACNDMQPQQYQVDQQNYCLLNFCDPLCAKLYNDNIYRIYADEFNYKNKYLNEELSASSKIIYRQAIDRLFIQLPEYIYPKKIEVCVGSGNELIPLSYADIKQDISSVKQSMLRMLK